MARHSHRQGGYNPYEDEQHRMEVDQSGPFGCPPYASYHPDPRAQALAQQQQQRSLQTSEQMLYGIYENTMGVIEELETFEEQGHGKVLPKSGLLDHLPAFNKHKGSQRPKRTLHDVQAVIEAELVSLEAQMMFAPSEAKERAKSAMIQRTLMWVAAREETGVPKGLVDEYVKNVLHVLNGKPMMLPPRKKGPPLDAQTANDMMYRIGQARHQGDLLDKEFRNNPEKRAALREFKHAGKDGRNGMRRMNNLDNDLR